MKAYRIVTYVVDLEEIGAESVVYEVTRSRHISIQAGAIDEIDIGEWDDDHPLNHRDTYVEAYFKERLQK